MTFLVAVLSCAGCLPASSRNWKSTPEKLASDYSIINDVRTDGDIVMLMWFAPPVVRADAPNAERFRSLLDKYIFLGVVHGHLDKTTGTSTFENIDTLEAKDEGGKTLALVERSNMNPASVGAVAVLERVFQQMLGAAGRGMKMFVFDADDVHACKKGKLSVPFAGETYTWETPFPGCS
jgi:hypothetical protein